MSWTDERVELLKKYWGEGLSASQIAGRLGGVTRNAVIGKVHRLGLSGRATPTRLKTTRARRQPAGSRRVTKQRHPKTGNSPLHNLYQDAEPYSAPVEEFEIPEPERKSLQDLTENSCRWPIGDPQLPDFHFCNRGKVPGLPYCEDHARRAFQPPQARRRGRIGNEAPQTVPVAVATSKPETVDA